MIKVQAKSNGKSWSACQGPDGKWTIWAMYSGANIKLQGLSGKQFEERFDYAAAGDSTCPQSS